MHKDVSLCVFRGEAAYKILASDNLFRRYRACGDVEIEGQSVGTAVR